VLKVHVARDGTLSWPRIVGSSGNTELDQASLTCATATYIMPIEIKGKAIAADWRIRIHWSLTDNSLAMPDYVLGGHCPGYPPISQRNNEEGTAVFRYRIGTDGMVSGVTITRSTGSARLDAASIACVSGWRFPIVKSAGVAIAGERNGSMSWVLH
jgi:TonB family protein